MKSKVHKWVSAFHRPSLHSLHITLNHPRATSQGRRLICAAPQVGVLLLVLILDHADVHRRRLKELRDPAYTAAEAERAAGLGVDSKQRGIEEIVKRLEVSGMDEKEA